MAAAKKAAKSKKTSVAKKKVTKQPAIKKAVLKNAATKKPVVKKRAVTPVVKKRAIKSMKKTTARPVVKNKAAAKALPVVSKSKELRATIAALKQRIKDLKSELKNTRKRADAVAALSSKRDAAIGKFSKGWDKKAMSALEKSLQPKKKKKSKK